MEQGRKEDKEGASSPAEFFPLLLLPRFYLTTFLPVSKFYPVFFEHRSGFVSFNSTTK